VSGSPGFSCLQSSKPLLSGGWDVLLPGVAEVATEPDEVNELHIPGNFFQ
jgi:hypothetical protein